MSQEENIFNFNHIDKNKTKEEIQEIKELYKFYHYKYWCHRQAFKHFRKLNLAINIASTGLTVIGAVAGGLTANPAILGSISGAGLVLKTLSDNEKLQKKNRDVKVCVFNLPENITWPPYRFARGPFDKNDFLKERNILDDTIVDFSPLVTRFEKQYAKKFLSRPVETE